MHYPLDAAVSAYAKHAEGRCAALTAIESTIARPLLQRWSWKDL